MSEIKKRMDEMENLYKEVKMDNKSIRKFIKDLKNIQKRSKKLDEYYHKDWLNDIENCDEFYEIINQDFIYEELMEQYTMSKKLIKILADYINM